MQFLGERTDLPTVLRGADLFLLPSESESFGLAALEAMSCGVPVIASRVGGVPEVVIDGETGLLAPVGDIAAMAAHVVRLLADAPLRARLGQAARARAETVFPLGGDGVRSTRISIDACSIKESPLPRLRGRGLGEGGPPECGRRISLADLLTPTLVLHPDTEEREKARQRALEAQQSRCALVTPSYSSPRAPS